MVKKWAAILPLAAILVTGTAVPAVAAPAVTQVRTQDCVSELGTKMLDIQTRANDALSKPQPDLAVLMAAWGDFQKLVAEQSQPSSCLMTMMAKPGRAAPPDPGACFAGILKALGKFNTSMAEAITPSMNADKVKEALKTFTDAMQTALLNCVSGGGSTPGTPAPPGSPAPAPSR
ncbi:hypothetical protein D5S17_31420 [Pseudonocardiaceae bacterium YIM PH 21723]|nr:hypothetical protein D5S17_31420 [Pseudonocardiaceae bacterium YIM PH 21723]